MTKTSRYVSLVITTLISAVCGIVLYEILRLSSFDLNNMPIPTGVLFHLLLVLLIFILSLVSIVFHVNILSSLYSLEIPEDTLNNVLDNSARSFKKTKSQNLLSRFYFTFSIAFAIHPIIMILTTAQRLTVSSYSEVFIVVTINIFFGIYLLIDARNIRKKMNRN